MAEKKKLNPKLVGIFDDLIDETVEILPDIPPPRETDRELVMFWRVEKCSRCHTTYEGSAYGTECMIQSILEKPIVHFGRFYGWKFVAVKYRPAPDFSCHDKVPRRVEKLHSTLRVCRKCIHKPKIIYLEDRSA